jgi:hypothetical protein
MSSSVVSINTETACCDTVWSRQWTSNQILQTNRPHPFRLRMKCDGTRAETRFRLSAKRMSPFKSAGASVQSTTGSLGVRNSGSNAEYTMFRGTVKSTGYPLHSPVSPSLPLPRVTVCHHISNKLYPCWYPLTKLQGVTTAEH